MTTQDRRDEVSASREEASGALQGVMTTASDDAERVRAAAGTVAEAMPGAVDQAQTAANQTAQTLETMPDQTLMLGAAFSLGMGVALFIAGASRILVLLSMAPASAMSMTLAGRNADSTGAAGTSGDA